MSKNNKIQNPTNDNLPAIIPFTFEAKEVRIMQDADGNPWWIAKDACDILEHTNHRVALQGLDDDEKGVRKVYTLGGEQEVWVVNESGLYTLIIRSNKPKAKAFRKWITSEVLPTIRKTGKYSNPRQPSLLTPEDRVSPELLTDRILEWMLAQSDPFDESWMNMTLGCSLGYARQCLRKFARKGLVVRGRDRYWRLTAKALLLIGSRERPQHVQVLNSYIATVDMRRGVPLDVQVQMIELHDHGLKQLEAQEKRLPAVTGKDDEVRLPVFMQEARTRMESPPVALAPFARAVDLGWKESSSGPYVEKLQQLHARLVGKVLYFFPVSWMAEALDMPIDTIKGMLDPEKFEIITDESGEIRKWLSIEATGFHLTFERDTYVTTFGLQRLMQVRERKSRKTPSITAIKDVFSACLDLIAIGTDLEYPESVRRANAATLKLTGVDCLKLMECEVGEEWSGEEWSGEEWSGEVVKR